MSFRASYGTKTTSGAILTTLLVSFEYVLTAINWCKLTDFFRIFDGFSLAQHVFEGGDHPANDSWQIKFLP
jgi:spore maturation protein SpmA